MKILEGFFNGDDSKKETSDDVANIRLRKEELDIAKSSVHKGDVEFGKEIIEEKKSVDVPVMHEEVIIERKSLNNEASDSPITEEQTIKIPVSEEKVNVDNADIVDIEGHHE